VFGVAVQTCLVGMWPMAGVWGFVQLSPRLSDLLHVLRLAETQQLLYLMGEQGFPGIGWEPRTKYGSFNCTRLLAFCVWIVLIGSKVRENRTLPAI